MNEETPKRIQMGEDRVIRLVDLGAAAPKTWKHLTDPCHEPDCSLSAETHALSRLSAWMLVENMPERDAGDRAYTFLRIGFAALGDPAWFKAIVQLSGPSKDDLLDLMNSAKALREYLNP